MKKSCPHCNSKNTKKNGHTHYGKQNHLCKDCGRQFVENGQDWFISDATKALIDKLLLERLSLAGIARVVSVSELWLQRYIKAKYKESPDDLNAEIAIPDQEEYLDNRYEEEIARLEKKSPMRAKNIRK